jgi:serine/threonine protein kinase
VKGLLILSSIGLVHGDIAPRNLLLRVAGDLKSLVIGDAGSSAITNSAGAASIRKYRSAHLAPETLNGEKHTIKGDLYSVGCVLLALMLRQDLAAMEERDLTWHEVCSSISVG